jgi:hypothetical protein
LWRTGQCDAITTGNALSNDRLWREHSRGVRDGEPVETTVARLKYFGIVMTDDRATWFADWIDPRQTTTTSPSRAPLSGLPT